MAVRVGEGQVVFQSFSLVPISIFRGRCHFAQHPQTGVGISGNVSVFFFG